MPSHPYPGPCWCYVAWCGHGYSVLCAQKPDIAFIDRGQVPHFRDEDTGHAGVSLMCKWDQIMPLLWQTPRWWLVCFISSPRTVPSLDRISRRMGCHLKLLGDQGIRAGGPGGVWWTTPSSQRRPHLQWPNVSVPSIGLLSGTVWHTSWSSSYCFIALVPWRLCWSCWCPTGVAQILASLCGWFSSSLVNPTY